MLGTIEARRIVDLFHVQFESGTEWWSRSYGIVKSILWIAYNGHSQVSSFYSIFYRQVDWVVRWIYFLIFRFDRDLTQALKPLQSIFKFENPSELKYGQLVLPYLPANFGPMYFCKLTRNGGENWNDSNEIDWNIC